MTRALACQGYTLFFRVYASLSPIVNSISNSRMGIYYFGLWQTTSLQTGWSFKILEVTWWRQQIFVHYVLV